MFLILEHVQVLAVNTAMVQGLAKSFDPCQRHLGFFWGQPAVFTFLRPSQTLLGPWMSP